MPPVIKVVAAILLDAEGRFLLARKKQGKPLAGYWEFPGGKVQPEESAENAIRREILEELNLNVTSCKLFCAYRYEKTDRMLDFSFFLCSFVPATPVLTDHDAIAWLIATDLPHYDLAPADRLAARLILEKGLAING